MKYVYLLIICLAVPITVLATTRYVNKHGSIPGSFTTIQAAIDASVDGDTVKVLPETYYEQITLDKNLLLMGSGYETTILTSYVDPTVRMSNGNLKWLTISSFAGNGITLKGGIVKNCVINSCTQKGVYSDSGTGFVINCVLVNNGSHGIFVEGGVLNVTNCIARPNGACGFEKNYNTSGQLNLSYSNGNSCNTSGNQGVIDEDPQFQTSTDFHLVEQSPCVDTGNPTLNDPDGSRSDIGYFGGPDTPIYPVVTSLKIIPLPGGGVRIEAVGVANY
ncbi:MAG: right-handed parallel beta-helix repeat-containing protein [Bacteroidota bacterium]|nr:right-handed parallel beta-helix repeat-containing protein [Bacteroidota bacterium]